MYYVKKNNSGKWIIINEGAKRATKSFESKSEAVNYAEDHYRNNYKIEGETEKRQSPKVNIEVGRGKNKRSVKLPVWLAVIVGIVAVIFVVYYFGAFDGVLKNAGLENITSSEVFKKTDSGSSSKNNKSSGTTGGNTDSGSGTTGGNSGSSGVTAEGVKYDDFQIHFMMLGNSYAGDSIYIKAGDTDILIDAGSRSGSFATTSAYINQYCTDKKLEYVIATHGDQDHIDAFDKFADAYTFGTIITNRYTSKTTQTYKDMVSAFNTQVSNGAKWYYADQCFNETDGAKKTYQLTANVTMDILYNYYYFDNNNDGKGDTSNENDYSVCVLFTYNDHHFLLTGDLEESGEEKMAAYYDGSSKNKTLPHVDLFKAGHHGSPTSSNDCLLAKITPDVCVVSCCSGTAEYTTNVDNQFPSQEFINRIAKYTDKVYVTSMITETNGNWGYTAMNGNIVVSSNGTDVGLWASNNLTKLKDTTWFNETIYVIDGNNVATKGRTDFYTSTTSGVTSRPRRTWPSA